MTSETTVQTLADITRLYAAERPDRIVMVYAGRDTTVAQLDRRASQVANGLIAEGLGPQSRIAVLDKNSDVFFETLFGAAKANVVLVAVNWRLAPSEMAYVINDAMTEVLFVGAEFFDALDTIRDELRTVKKIVALDGSPADWEPYSAWRDRQRVIDPVVPVDGSDVIVQMYTSGTTGRPKGAQLTHNNLVSLLRTALGEWGDWSDQDVNLVCMPVFHIAGSGWALVGFYAGAKNVIVREVVPTEILRVVSEYHVTKTIFVPSVILFLLQTPGIQEADLSSLKLIVYGASPMPLDLLRRAMATFQCGFGHVYGLTETTGGIVYLPPEEHDLTGGPRLRSCGQPLSHVQLRIVDAEGKVLPPGEIGEIICRSPQNMKGYWNLPEETARTIRDGWLYTGDAGYLDADGYLYIHDRIKDMIITGGENVYPAEVESALFSHPAVADVAVIGVPDDRWGEAVKAIVVKKPGAEVTAEELIAFARQRIARYKAPRSVDFVEALPRNPSGKLLKRELRAPYWGGRER
jgi:acyl-CoA synthetase (AMP-forming)/AMP-acid ligase II